VLLEYPHCPIGLVTKIAMFINPWQDFRLETLRDRHGIDQPLEFPNCCPLITVFEKWIWHSIYPNWLTFTIQNPNNSKSKQFKILDGWG